MGSERGHNTNTNYTGNYTGNLILNGVVFLKKNPTWIIDGHITPPPNKKLPDFNDLWSVLHTNCNLEFSKIVEITSCQVIIGEYDMGLVQLENANLYIIIMITIIDQNSNKSTKNKKSNQCLGRTYHLLALLSCLSFFFLSGLREASTVLLESISPILFLYFEPTGGGCWWYIGPFLSQQLG